MGEQFFPKPCPWTCSALGRLLVLPESRTCRERQDGAMGIVGSTAPRLPSSAMCPLEKVRNKIRDVPGVPWGTGDVPGTGRYWGITLGCAAASWALENPGANIS